LRQIPSFAPCFHPLSAAASETEMRSSLPSSLLLPVFAQHGALRLQPVSPLLQARSLWSSVPTRTSASQARLKMVAAFHQSALHALFASSLSISALRLPFSISPHPLRLVLEQIAAYRLLLLPHPQLWRRRFPRRHSSSAARTRETLLPKTPAQAP